jgi:hypothetical protein
MISMGLDVENVSQRPFRITKVLWGSRGRFFKRAPWPPEALK